MNTPISRKLLRALKKLAIQALIIVAVVLIGVAAWKFIGDKREAQASDPTKYTAAAISTSTQEEATVSAVPNMDFMAQQQNAPDVIAWLTIDHPKVKIDYPVVQSGDNEYYLTRTPAKKKNDFGSVFMDFRCHNDFSDFYNVLYAHTLDRDKTRMFGPLLRFKEKQVFDEIPTALLYTPEHVYELQFFSCAVVWHKDQNYYVNLAYFAPAEKDAFLANLKETAMYWRDIPIGYDDHIVALSTCSKEFENARTVVLGKLVEVG